MEVCLHIGLHKTGTTSLQALLEHNRARLGPDVAIFNHNSDALLPVQRACLAFARNPGPETGAAISDPLAQLLAAEAMRGRRKVLVSSEMLSGPVPALHRKGPLGGHAVQIAPWLRKAVEGFRAEFCLYIRDQERWLISLHAHLLRSRGIRLTRRAFLQRVADQGFRIEELAEATSAALGAAQVFRMEDEIATRLGPGTGFLNLAGFDDAALAELEPVAPQNTGLSKQTVERMEAPALLALPAIARRYLARIMDGHTEKRTSR